MYSPFTGCLRLTSWSMTYSCLYLEEILMHAGPALKAFWYLVEISLKQRWCLEHFPQDGILYRPLPSLRIGMYTNTPEFPFTVTHRCSGTRDLPGTARLWRTTLPTGVSVVMTDEVRGCACHLTGIQTRIPVIISLNLSFSSASAFIYLHTILFCTRRISPLHPGAS